MEYMLRWGVLAITAVLDDKGVLHFVCPFCGETTFMGPSQFRVTGRDVRTMSMVLCEHGHCGIPYEIVHSCFVPWQPLGLDKWCLYDRWYRPEQMHTVWKTHNERHHERQ